MTELATLAPTERTPALMELVRAADLRRVLAPFVAGRVDGIAVYAVDGASFCAALADGTPVARWEQLPVEAPRAVQRGEATFSLGDRSYDVRPLYAGAERVAYLVISRDADADAGVDAERRLADGLGGAVGQLLQSGFAAWVASELHLVASVNRYQEITQRNAELQRAVEHLRELDKLKSNFLATVSHELRTPLTSVIGFSEMLLEGIAGPLGEEQAEYVRTILIRGEELLNLITQILEMSQLEVGAVRLDLGPHELAPLLQRAVDAVRLSAERAGIALAVEVGELPRVLVDADKLQRIVLNLLGNAIKFTGSGGRVAIRAQPAPIRRPFQEETLFGEEAADAVRITVSDTGQGIAPDQLGRIFEAFYQLDAGPTRQHGGAGLGLSIVKSLVTAHGGEVWVDSVVGSGTSVHFTVPIAGAEVAM